jgi:hypothetical protein
METLFLDLEIFSKNTLQIFLVIFENYRLLFVRVFTLISDILSLTMETLFLDLGIFSKNTLLIFLVIFEKYRLLFVSVSKCKLPQV